MRYAVFKIGNRQYIAEEGRVIDVSLLDKKGGEIEFSDILMIRDNNTLIVDNLSLCKIKGKILGEKKGEKITIMKHIRRKGYHKKQGYRERYTSVFIEKIVGP